MIRSSLHRYESHIRSSSSMREPTEVDTRKVYEGLIDVLHENWFHQPRINHRVFTHTLAEVGVDHNNYFYFRMKTAARFQVSLADLELAAIPNGSLWSFAQIILKRKPQLPKQ